MKIQLKKSFAWVLCIYFIFVTLCSAVYKAVLIDNTSDSTLTLCYENGMRKLTDVQAKLYRVADVLEGPTYRLAGEYEKYASYISFNSIETAAGWTAVSETLAAYTVADGIKENLQGKTNEEGILYFSTVPSGLYLLVSDRVTYPNEQFTFAPALLILPSVDNDGNYNNSPVVYPKSQRYENTIESQPITRKVVKRWIDSEGEIGRASCRERVLRLV